MADKRYNHYIQKYPQGYVKFEKVDLEKHYRCHYKQFKDFAFDGEIKNIYTEDYAEQSGSRIWIPDKEDLAFKSYDCTLELLFDKETAQDDVRFFYKDIRGQLIEYSDTFRNRFVTLVLIKQPTISQEILYGNRPYMLVQFVFSNVHGTTSDISQIG